MACSQAIRQVGKVSNRIRLGAAEEYLNLHWLLQNFFLHLISPLSPHTTTFTTYRIYKQDVKSFVDACSSWNELQLTNAQIARFNNAIPTAQALNLGGLVLAFVLLNTNLPTYTFHRSLSQCLTTAFHQQRNRTPQTQDSSSVPQASCPQTNWPSSQHQRLCL